MEDWFPDVFASRPRKLVGWPGLFALVFRDLLPLQLALVERSLRDWDWVVMQHGPLTDSPIPTCGPRCPVRVDMMLLWVVWS